MELVWLPLNDVDDENKQFIDLVIAVKLYYLSVTSTFKYLCASLLLGMNNLRNMKKLLT